jgi:hypothetical protein
MRKFPWIDNIRKEKSSVSNQLTLLAYLQEREAKRRHCHRNYENL